MTIIKVAMFEDNQIFRESLLEFIDETPGFKIVAAQSSAQNIVECIQKSQPHVVLMDIDMPGMNGIKATEIVKSNFPQVNILMLTVYEDDQNIFDAILAGATGYLLKKHHQPALRKQWPKSMRAVHP